MRNLETGEEEALGEAVVEVASSGEFDVFDLAGELFGTASRLGLKRVPDVCEKVCVQSFDFTHGLIVVIVFEAALQE